LQPKAWPSLELTTRPFTPTWTKFQTESKRTSNNWRKDFPDHPKPSNQRKLWKQQSRCSTKHTQNQNTKFQNTPPVKDDGDGPPGCTPLKLWTSSTTKPKRGTTNIKYWGTQWRKFSSRTPFCQTKSPKNIRPLQRNSRRITQKNINTKPEWPDLQDQVQPPKRRRLPSGSYESWRLHRSRSKQSAHWEKRSTFSHTQLRKIIKRKNTKPSTKRNLSSKRRSESESKIHDQQERLNLKSENESRDKNYCQHKTQNFESESRTKNEDVKAIKVRKEEALAKIKAKVTMKVNEVKPTENTLTGPRIKRKKQLNQKIGSEPTSTLLSRLSALCNIFIFIYILIIFISNLIVSDPSDHPFQTIPVGELSDCKTFCLP
jgi:hypothetical protein